MVRLQSPSAKRSSSSAVSIAQALQQTLVVIDAGVDEYKQLVAGIASGVKVLILEANQDGIEQITQSLKAYGNITTLQIMAHGAPGCLRLGNIQLSLETIDRYTWDLTSWFPTTHPQTAALLLYACNVANGEIGTTFLAKLRHLTEAKIAASSTPIGKAELGGNWDLDVTSGAIDLIPVFQDGVLEAYSGLLDKTYQKLSTAAFAQNWSNSNLITANDNWNAVPGIVGYRGDGLTSVPGTDPRTVVADGTTTPIDVNANQANPNFFTTGGVTEFAIANPTVAIQGSGTANAPFLLFHLDTTEVGNVHISYNLRDIDGSADNAISQVALQYRIGETGDFINVPDGYIADASVGPTATQFTPVMALLPSAVDNQQKVQIRIITADTLSNDEWIGIDDVNITASKANQAPILTGNATLTTIDEDSDNAINIGDKITDLINGLSTDADHDLQAIAVIGADNSNGIWQYSKDGGATWTEISGTVADSNAVVLGATSLYSASLGTAPASQGWLAFANISGASQIATSNGTALNTTANNSIYAGYSNFEGGTLVNPNFPILNHTTGYSISFNLQMLAEAHANQSSAGFSIVVVSNDKTKAIELGFQQLSPTTGNIFAQDSSFTAAESAAYNTNLDTNYTLKVEGDGYKLLAEGTEVLSGTLRDYSSFAGFPDPYEVPNFIFLGDKTPSAQGWFNLSQVAVKIDTRVRFVPNPNYNGTAHLNFRTWDTTNGLTDGITGVNASVNGGATAYSATVGMAAITINAINDAPTGVVTVDGVAQENQTLTANPASLIDVDGLGTFSYQWQSGDGNEWIDIADATNSNFTPNALQVGKLVRVRLTYTDQQGTPETVFSSSTSAIVSGSSSVSPLVLTLNTDTGVSPHDGITQTNQPQLSGQGQPNSQIQVFAGQLLLGTVTADATGHWTLTTPLLADGKYEVFFTSTDQSNGSKLTSPKLNLTIDTTPSNAAITAGYAIREVSPDTVKIRFSEVMSNFDVNDLVLTQNGRPISLREATLTTIDNITWTLGNLAPITTAEGRYQLTLKQSDIIDLAGNGLIEDAVDTWLLGRTGIPLPQIRFQNGKSLGKRRISKDGNDRLIGTPLNDVLRGGNGDDFIISGFGKAQFGIDRLAGEAGNDRLISGKGNDVLDGGNGDDWLRAGKGDDLLQGGDGNDNLTGNAGADVIVGSIGDDRLSGGNGSDTFVYQSLTDGTDTITDFSAVDLLDLRLIFAQPEFSGDNAFARFIEFVRLEQVNGDVKISMDLDGNGGGKEFSSIAVIKNISLDKISASKFLIA